MLRNVLLSEFQANVGTPTAIMRGNSATSRIMGIFCRMHLPLRRSAAVAGIHF